MNFIFKKIFSVVFALIFIFASTAMAAEPASVIISTIDTVAEYVEIPVYITAIPDRIENIMSIDFKYSFDSEQLEYVSTIKGTTTGSLFTSKSGEVHWADTTDISKKTPKITADTIGEEFPFFKLKFRVLVKEGMADIRIDNIKITGCFALDNNSVEVVKPSSSSYKGVDGGVVVVGKTSEATDIYRMEEKKALTIDMTADAVPYINGNRALRFDEDTYVYMLGSDDTYEITLNYEDAPELIKSGRIHREDKVTAMDAFLTINASAGIIDNEFEKDINKIFYADADKDFTISATDALIINNLSLGKGVLNVN